MDTDTVVTVLVRDRDRFWQLDQVNEWDGTTLVAAVSSDPRSFRELALAWSRYRPNEALDDLPWRPANGDTPSGDWILIDLACLRLVASSAKLIPHERCSFQRDDEEWHPDMPIVWWNLAPWWEHVVASSLEGALPPIPPPVEPVPFRNVLFGREMAQFVADRMLALTTTESLPDEYVDRDELPWDGTVNAEARAIASRWYGLTKRVHAEWLLSECDALEGKTPRSFLHPGRDWVGWEIEHRTREWTKFKRAPRPLDRDTYAYRHGPTGLEEVVVYFDFCRKVILFGWRLIGQGERDRQQLADAIYAHGQEWLDHGSIEGDRTSPRAMIDSSRRHMPRLADGTHLDCDCPLCRMIADESGPFGLMFTGFDGHHLELDDEFAFSLCETEEEWRQQQEEFGTIEAEYAKSSDDADDSQKEDADDAFASVWKSSYVADDADGGLGISTLTLGFRLTEILSDLKKRPGTRKRITALNERFDAIRLVEDDDALRRLASKAMKAELEALATEHTSMTSKIADLESQLDAWTRVPR